MRAPSSAIALLFVLSTQAQLSAQATPPAPPTRAQVMAAAKEIMLAARYTTLITIGSDGRPQARIVDPFPPESDLTIWIGTNPVTRKVQEIRRDARVTLMYFSPAELEYVTVHGTAVLDTAAAQKAAHWKPEWAYLYKDQNRGEDYVLFRVKPSRLEVVSTKRGIANDPKTWLPVTVDLPK